MELKSYFCPRCGRGFNRKEAVATDEKVQCVYCRDTQLCIAGWPYVLLAMFLGVAAYLARITNMQVHGEVWVFLPAAFGLFLIGVIRMIQEAYRRKHPLSRIAQDEIAEDASLPPTVPPATGASADSQDAAANDSDQPTQSASSQQ